MEWEKYFESGVLSKGKDYYKKGRVLEFFEDGCERTAVVLGSDEYTVHLSFRPDGTLTGMDCSCPYADEGEYCKHMAAALFRNTYGENVKPVKKKPQSEAAAERAAELAFYKEKFKNIAAGFKKDGWVDCRYFGECAEYASIKMKEYADRLIAEKRYTDAFDISFYALKRICPAGDYHETKKDTDSLIAFASGIWTFLLETPVSEKYIFRKLTSYAGSDREYMIKRKTDRFLAENFAKPEYAKQLIRHFDRELEEYAVCLWNPGNLECCLENKIVLLHNLDADAETFAAFRRQYWQYDTVQKDYVEECIRAKKFGEAEKVLLESYGSEEFVLFPRYCRQKLSAIYYETGEDEKYARILYDTVVNERFDIARYRELKDLYTEEEWTGVREKIFASVSDRDSLPEMYVCEKLYDRVLRCIKTFRDLWIADKYFGVLADACPERLRGKYERCLRDAVAMGSVYDYEEVARILRKLPRVQGGRELVSDLAREWRVKYKRRRSLMEMLDKVITE